MGKILIVDNEEQVLTSYSDALKMDAHSIVTSLDVMDALKKLKLDKVDVIITDLNMEKITGSKFIELLQAERGVLPCPVIISSGFIDNQVIDSFAGNTRIHFLPKPTSLTELREKVKDVILHPLAISKIDVRFINPILNATIDVISKMTEFTVTAGKPYVKKKGECSGDISGVVGVVSSGFKGTVSLSFPEAGFLAIVSKMLGEEYKTINEENKDAVAELLNIIFGAAKKVLNEGGMNIKPAIPIIVQGNGHSLSHHSQHQTIVIPFVCPELGDFRSEVSSMGSSLK